MKKKLRVVLVWVAISLVLQLSAYSYLNYKVNQVLRPQTTQSQPPGPILASLTVLIPDTNLQNAQVSYDRGYLAYKENGIFKVFNFKKEKVVFEKPAPSGDKDLGVLDYQWLPDRDTLIYFYAKKNPNPVTYVTIPVEQPKTESEDPHAQNEKNVPAEPKVEKRYNNPQLTELYTLDFADPKEDSAPDDRANITVNSFPAGGQISQMAFSPSTNMMYISVKSGTTMHLFEIDVMKNVRIISKAGEWINNLAASGRHDILYVESKVGGVKTIQAVKGYQRTPISKNAGDTILGVNNGTLYLGEVKNKNLVKIMTTPDESDLKASPPLKTVWEGSIPFKNASVVIGSKQQIIIYDRLTAYVVQDGKEKQIPLDGDESYISPDGAELVQLTRQGSGTEVVLRPLEQ